MCAVMKMGEVKVFTKCHLLQKFELLRYFRVKDGGESVAQAWNVKPSLPNQINAFLLVLTLFAPFSPHSLARRFFSSLFLYFSF